MIVDPFHRGASPPSLNGVPIIMSELMPIDTSPNNAVYEKVNTTADTRPALSVQWKGTDVCLDFWCGCGESYHFDGDFCYQVQCPKCGAIYGLDQAIRLVPLTAEESELYGCLKIMQPLED